jgi:hypothetical protein
MLYLVQYWCDGKNAIEAEKIHQELIARPNSGNGKEERRVGTTNKL